MKDKDDLPWDKATHCGYDLVKGHTKRMINPECEGETHGRFIPELEARELWARDQQHKAALANRLRTNKNEPLSIERYKYLEKENAFLRKQVEVLSKALGEYAESKNYELEEYEGWDFSGALDNSGFTDNGYEPTRPWLLAQKSIKKADAIAKELEE